MSLPKGRTNNPKGRPAGKPNKTTSEIKGLLLAFIGDNIGNLQKDLDNLEPKDRLTVLEKLLKYIIPTKTEEINDLDKLTDEQVDKVIESLKKNHNG